MSCLICFCPIEGVHIKCTDPRCLGSLCEECVTRFVNVAHSSGGQKLSCVQEGCHGEYDQVSLAGLPFSVLKTYREALLQYFSKEKKSEIDENLKHAQLVDTLRRQRMEFYTKNMPSAVLKVAKIAFVDKLKKVQKAEAARQAKGYRRICINIFCKGYLDEHMKCNQCSVAFCELCEEEKSAEHVCKEADKESVAFVKSIRKCPQCGTAIEKGEGCMAMTCAVCNTNFWYNTGEKSEAGNHGKSIPVLLTSFRQLNIEYAGDLPSTLRLKLQELESKFAEPFASDAALIAAATRARLTERLSDFSGLYSKTARAKMEKMMLGKKLTQIQRLLSEKPDGFLSVLADALVPKEVRKVVMYKGELRDGVVYAEEIGVAENVKDASAKLQLDAESIRHALDMNSGTLGDYFFQYEF